MVFCMPIRGLSRLFWVVSACIFAAARASAESVPIDMADLDNHATACEDFYQYACGGWIARAEIPQDRPEWSRGFATINRENEELLKGALEEYAAAGDSLTGEKRQLGAFYASCMDESNIERASLAALQRRLAVVDVIKDARAVAVQVARYHLEGATALFSFGSGQDSKNSSEQIGDADQGGLTLPDRDYYLDDSKRFAEIRTAFSKHVESMFTLFGEGKAQARADAAVVLAIETDLARVSADKVSRRDPNAMYNRLNRRGLMGLAPAFDWDTYFATLGYPKLSAINVDVPVFFTGLDKMLRKLSVNELRTYLRWHLIHASASALGRSFVQEDFNFTGKALTGQPELQPRWKRCVNSTLHAMAEPVGKVFVEKKFSPQAKIEAQAMINAVELAMADRLTALDWMDSATRQQAATKLNRVVNSIGYPDKWRNFAGLKVDRGSYFSNRQVASVFNSRFYLDKIGKPVDRTDWFMPPSMVNAYYSADNNKMVFPAGILQSPFYQEGRPASINYGGIGMVMGHELTHGFDDQGRKFDASGNLRDWWSPVVGKEFDQRAECVVNQYSKYVAVDDVHVNGRLTLGENLADLGGIRLAYKAWEKNHADTASEVAGFTPSQQFFIGYAQTWCNKQRPEMARLRATTDPHSPARFRVNGPLSNFDEFAKAFSCRDGAPMAPANRCRVW